MIFKEPQPVSDFRGRINKIIHNAEHQQLRSRAELLKSQSIAVKQKQLERAESLYRQSIEKSIEKNTPVKYRGISECRDKKLLSCKNSILFGGFGTGKTYEAFSCAHTLMRSESIQEFKATTEVEILNDIKSSVNNATYNPTTYLIPDLLIVDEFGKNNDSDFNKAQIFNILNKRYEWDKKTIIICNLANKEEIAEVFPLALLDRFREYSREFSGKSRR